MCTPERGLRSAGRQTGISLIELVMFIMIVSIGVAGILSVINVTTRTSVDPLTRKQAVAVAESMLEEIQQQPFTYCDPDDALVTTSSGACAGPIQSLGPTASESRGTTTGLDNVIDYSGFTMTGISTLDDVSTVVLPNYRVDVTIAQETVGGVGGDASLRIDVRVTSPPFDAVTNPTPAMDITLTGYRLRYAPNSAS
jgi:MSHA pilin protein MshD